MRCWTSSSGETGSLRFARSSVASSAARYSASSRSSALARGAAAGTTWADDHWGVPRGRGGGGPNLGGRSLGRAVRGGGGLGGRGALRSGLLNRLGDLAEPGDRAG